MEDRAEQQLEELEKRRAALLQAGGVGGDATLMNQGARMTSLFQGKEMVHQLRVQFKGKHACFGSVCGCGSAVQSRAVRLCQDASSTVMSLRMPLLLPLPKP